MKTKVRREKVNNESDLLACYDVSGEELHFCSEHNYNGEIYGIEEVISNTTRSIKNHFLELEDMRRGLGLENIHVFCEPTGGYEKTLILVARQMNYKVSYVSSEATKKARVIESNDDSKSDSKDKYIVLTLAQMSKILNCRQLPSAYAKLRLLGEYYNNAADQAMRIRTEIASVKLKLFPDFPFKCTYLYTKAGEVLISKYGFNPFKIVQYGWEDFWQKMKHSLRQPEKSKLKNIYRNAASVIKYISEGEVEIAEKQLMWLWRSYQLSVERKLTLKDELCCLYKTLPEYTLLSKVKNVSDNLMARVIAETGPLSDFKNVAQILRYAGLNLRVRQSGKYRGLNKISKKGRSLLRKVLYQVVFASFISEGDMYYDYFKRKKQESGNGLIAMTSIMRKVLKLIFGVSRSNIEFNLERVHRDQNDFNALGLTA